MHNPWIPPTLLALLLGITTSCSTQPKKEQPATPTQMDAYLKNTVDARRYGLTVYSSDAGHYFKNSIRTHPGQTEQFKFKSKNKSPIPLIKFDITSGQTLHAILDTSTRQSWLPLDLANTLNIETLGPRLMRLQPTHVNDPLNSYIGFLWHMEINSLQLTSVPLAIRPAFWHLGPLARAIQKPKISLVIGNDILKEFATVHFNFPQRKVTIASTRNYSPSRDTLLARLPLKRYKDSIVLQARIPGYAGYFILDTAGDYELALPNPSSPTADFFKMQHIEHNDLRIIDSAPWTTENSNLPRIGARLLAKYKMTLDGKNNMIYFETPQPEK